ncbi:MAG: hypothetical protein HOQ12_00090 [Gemmatimonadaceae bacterium]|nr:hypothetical protein [Gemmatimonadaceae bacterium]
MIARHAARMRSILLALAGTALVAVGCQPDGPTAPATLRCPGARVPLCTDATRAAAVHAAVSDAGSRLAPSLTSRDASAQLGEHLTGLEASLSAGDVTGARAALVRTRGALAEARAGLASHPGDAPDLDAIALTLDEIAAVLADA